MNNSVFILKDPMDLTIQDMLVWTEDDRANAGSPSARSLLVPLEYSSASSQHSSPSPNQKPARKKDVFNRRDTAPESQYVMLPRGKPEPSQTVQSRFQKPTQWSDLDHEARTILLKEFTTLLGSFQLAVITLALSTDEVQAWLYRYYQQQNDAVRCEQGFRVVVTTEESVRNALRFLLAQHLTEFAHNFTKWIDFSCCPWPPTIDISTYNAAATSELFQRGDQIDLPSNFLKGYDDVFNRQQIMRQDPMVPEELKRVVPAEHDRSADLYTICTLGLSNPGPKRGLRARCITVLLPAGTVVVGPQGSKKLTHSGNYEIVYPNHEEYFNLNRIRNMKNHTVFEIVDKLPLDLHQPQYDELRFERPATSDLRNKTRLLNGQMQPPHPIDDLDPENQASADLMKAVFAALPIDERSVTREQVLAAKNQGGKTVLRAQQPSGQIGTGVVVRPSEVTKRVVLPNIAGPVERATGGRVVDDSPVSEMLTIRLPQGYKVKVPGGSVGNFNAIPGEPHCGPGVGGVYSFHFPMMDQETSYQQAKLNRGVHLRFSGFDFMGLIRNDKLLPRVIGGGTHEIVEINGELDLINFWGRYNLFHSMEVVRESPMQVPIAVKTPTKTPRVHTLAGERTKQPDGELKNSAVKDNQKIAEKKKTSPTKGVQEKEIAMDIALAQSNTTGAPNQPASNLGRGQKSVSLLEQGDVPVHSEETFNVTTPEKKRLKLAQESESSTTSVEDQTNVPQAKTSKYRAASIETNSPSNSPSESRLTRLSRAKLLQGPELANIHFSEELKGGNKPTPRSSAKTPATTKTPRSLKHELSRSKSFPRIDGTSAAQMAKSTNKPVPKTNTHVSAPKFLPQLGKFKVYKIPASSSAPVTPSVTMETRNSALTATEALNHSTQNEQTKRISDEVKKTKGVSESPVGSRTRLQKRLLMSGLDGSTSVSKSSSNSPRVSKKRKATATVEAPTPATTVDMPNVTDDVDSSTAALPSSNQKWPLKSASKRSMREVATLASASRNSSSGDSTISSPSEEKVVQLAAAGAENFDSESPRIGLGSQPIDAFIYPDIGTFVSQGKLQESFSTNYPAEDREVKQVASLANSTSNGSSAPDTPTHNDQGIYINNLAFSHHIGFGGIRSPGSLTGNIENISSKIGTLASEPPWRKPKGQSLGRGRQELSQPPALNPVPDLALPPKPTFLNQVNKRKNDGSPGSRSQSHYNTGYSAPPAVPPPNWNTSPGYGPQKSWSPHNSYPVKYPVPPVVYNPMFDCQLPIMSPRSTFGTSIHKSSPMATSPLGPDGYIQQYMSSHMPSAPQNHSIPMSSPGYAGFGGPPTYSSPHTSSRPAQQPPLQPSYLDGAASSARSTPGAWQNSTTPLANAGDQQQHSSPQGQYGRPSHHGGFPTGSPRTGL
ncbi:hypothetical protein BX600DRAFT_428831 [Xylariales sp. PMI_506]|nr:hypothetical protein BX600DRAFT_428831 [Xylariales sp. PMI_506]